MYGNESGERAPRRRRRRDDPTETAPQTIIERVNSESAKLAPIRDDQPPPTRTSHRQRSGSHHQPTGEHHPVPEPPNGMPGRLRSPPRDAPRPGMPLWVPGMAGPVGLPPTSTGWCSPVGWWWLPERCRCEVRVGGGWSSRIGASLELSDRKSVV